MRVDRNLGADDLGQQARELPLHVGRRPAGGGRGRRPHQVDGPDGRDDLRRLGVDERCREGPGGQRDRQLDGLWHRQPDHLRDGKPDRLRHRQLDHLRGRKLDHLRNGEPHRLRHRQPDRLRNGQLHHLRNGEPHRLRHRQPDHLRNRELSRLRHWQPDHLRNRKLDRLRRRGPASRQYRGLDLVQLGPVAACRFLPVEPAVGLDLAVRVDPAQVAGAEDPTGRVRRDAQEVGDERLLGEVVAVQVAAGEPDTRDADLADLPVREGVERVRHIEDDGAVGGQGDPDGRRLVRVQLGPGGRHGGLGRTVDGQEPPTGLVPTPDEVLGAVLPGHQQEPQVGEVRVERGQQARNAAQRGDAARAQEGVQVLAPQGDAGGPGHQGRADGPRHPDLLDREVVRDRHALVHAVPRPDAVHLGGDLDEVADAPVVDGDAGEPALGPLPVGDVGERAVPQSPLGVREPVRPLLVDQRCCLVEADDLGAPGGEQLDLLHPVHHVRRRQHRSHPGVVDDGGQPVRREARVHGDVGGPDLQDREDRHVGVRRTVEQQADPVAGVRAAQPQEPSQLVGAGVELVVGERLLGGVDRELARPTVGAYPVAALLEQAVEALVRADPPALRLVLVDQHQLGHRDGPPDVVALGNRDEALHHLDG